MKILSAANTYTDLRYDLFNLSCIHTFALLVTQSNWPFGF